MISVNQVRHVYVANTVATKVDSTSPVGTISVGGDAEKGVFFNYVSPGGIVRSDLIKNVLYAKATEAAALRIPMKKVKVVLNQEVNNGSPVASQDYILTLKIKQAFALGEANEYIKYASVRALGGMTASDFYKKLAMSLKLNFSRETNTFFKFILIGTSGETDITSATKEADLTDTYTGLYIEEAPQPWRLGNISFETVNFSIYADTITWQGDEYQWGTVTKVPSTTFLPNSKKTADLEWFALGDRGDYYRGAGYPNVIYTEYVADGNLPDGYSYLDIHFAYVGAGNSVQKSEKTITIVVPATQKTLFQTLLTNVKAAGIEVTTAEAGD